MPDLTPEIAADVVAACQQGAEEAAAALGRALDHETVTVAAGESSRYDPAAPPEGFDGPGLAIVLTFGKAGAVALLPESSGLLPDWIAAPDESGENKLNTLAQELSMLLIPEALAAESYAAGRVDHLSEALARAKMAEDAVLAPLTLTAGEQLGQLTLLWPCAAPGDVLPPNETAEAAPGEDQASAAEAPPIASTPTGRASIASLSQLPGYARSLLRVEVPVTASLASKKQSIQEIVDLGPGAIISFEKSCDDPLVLSVGEETIALGEAVKVGEKFGIRLTEMILPEEQFKKVSRPAS